MAYKGMLDYHRRASNLTDALDRHYEDAECGGKSVCIRCQNLDRMSEELLADTPKWLLVMIAIVVFVSHPIQMIKLRGDFRTIYRV